MLVDEHGVPLSLIVNGANRHDSVSSEPLLKGLMLEPKDGNTPFNLCLDGAYVGKEDVVISNGFVPHIRPRGEEKKLIERDPTFKARRWVVELAHSWFNRFRKLLPRYEKTDLSYIKFSRLHNIEKVERIENEQAEIDSVETMQPCQPGCLSKFFVFDEP